VMGMHTATSTIENGFVYLPEKARGSRSTCTSRKLGDRKL